MFKKWLVQWKSPSAAEIQVLCAVQSGWTLKSHRYLDGKKVYRLHSLNGEEIELPDAVVEPLIQRRWVHSNQKFPAATFLLTDAGCEILAQTGHNSESVPFGARRFFTAKDEL
ncbi:hypothetical protein GC175_21085 [bacterium]|nr:hypothetical protein [bacterium]